VGWFTAEELAELAMNPSHRKRLNWAISQDEPHIDPEDN